MSEHVQGEVPLYQPLKIRVHFAVSSTGCGDKSRVSVKLFCFPITVIVNLFYLKTLVNQKSENRGDFKMLTATNAENISERRTDAETDFG